MFEETWILTVCNLTTNFFCKLSLDELMDTCLLTFLRFLDEVSSFSDALSSTKDFGTVQFDRLFLLLIPLRLLFGFVVLRLLSSLLLSLVWVVFCSIESEIPTAGRSLMGSI